MVWIIFLIIFFIVFAFLIFNAVAILFLSTGSFLRTILRGGRKRNPGKPGKPGKPLDKKYRHGAEEAEYEIIE